MYEQKLKELFNCLYIIVKLLTLKCQKLSTFFMLLNKQLNYILAAAGRGRRVKLQSSGSVSLLQCCGDTLPPSWFESRVRWCWPVQRTGASVSRWPAVWPPPPGAFGLWGEQGASPAGGEIKRKVNRSVFSTTKGIRPFLSVCFNVNDLCAPRLLEASVLSTLFTNSTF